MKKIVRVFFVSIMLFSLVILMTGCRIPMIGDSGPSMPSPVNRYEIGIMEYRDILLQRLGGFQKTDSYMSFPIAITTPDGCTVDMTGVTDEYVYEELYRLDKAIYGLKDDRKDYYQVINPNVIKNMNAVASLWKSYGVQRNLYGTMTVKTSRYGPTMGLCRSEPFWEQTIGAFCTGFLISEDIVVTAGHCTSTTSLQTCKIVFGYRMDSPTKVITTVPNQDVYGVKEVIARKKTEDGLDFAILRLDRKCNRTPLKLAQQDVKNGDYVYIIGYPVGLPIKYADDARVVSVSGKYTFNALLDAYGGNSGSPVFNSRDEVVGILVRGMPDFVTVGECRRSMMVPISAEEYFGEFVTKISQFIEFIPSN